MKNKTNINFNITVHFGNGATIEKGVTLSKAYKLSLKDNVIVPEDTEFVEIKSVDNSIIIPINMTFVVASSPEFKHVDKVNRYALYKRDKGRCSYCGKVLSEKESTIDHVIPRSLGGQNSWENCVLACKKCNSTKDNKTLEESGMKLLIKPYNPKKIK